MMEKPVASPLFDRLFETSWEVCNKIGGIYTVLSTKAKTLQNIYKDKTIFIGPDVWSAENPSPWFSECRVAGISGWASKAKLPEGVSKNEFYGKMWDLYGVDSLHAYGDYDEGCAFAHAAGIVIESIVNTLGTPQNRTIAHFDEWTTGMGLLYVKWKLPLRLSEKL